MHPRDYHDTYWRTDLRNEVFVAMSFESEFQNAWKCSIEPAVLAASNGALKPVRIDATTLTGDTVLRILDGISNCRLVFVDISIQRSGRWAGQRNGNVMYELGLAHAWRQSAEVIMVRNDSDPINFDVQNMFVHNYSSSDLHSAKSRFQELIDSSLKEIDLTKSLKVEKAVQGLDHILLKFMQDYASHEYFACGSYPAMDGSDTPVSALRADFLHTHAIDRLLNLGILITDVHGAEGRYAFHWSSFGKAVLRRIGVTE